MNSNKMLTVSLYNLEKKLLFLQYFCQISSQSLHYIIGLFYHEIVLRVDFSFSSLLLVPSFDTFLPNVIIILYIIISVSCIPYINIVFEH